MEGTSRGGDLSTPTPSTNGSVAQLGLWTEVLGPLSASIRCTPIEKVLSLTSGLG